ncbi:MAG: M81 family metallopeptidase, partial [Litorilinea sp.]
MRFAILGMYHETNTFAVEKNDTIDLPIQTGEEVLRLAHPRSYIGGFAEVAGGAGAELIPIARIDFTHALRGGLITAPVYKHFQDLLINGLQAAGAVDGVYFALHGAMDVEAPWQDAEACLIRAARDLLGPDLPFVATYDFHSNYAPGECQAAVPFPYNTNPHVDGYERGREAAECLLGMVRGTVQPV